jgi:hypothetical protein
MYDTVHYNYIIKVDSRNCEMLIRLSQYVIWICRKYGYSLTLPFLSYFHIMLHLFVENGVLLDLCEDTNMFAS